MTAAPTSCALSVWHRPKPNRFVIHHKLPLSWQGQRVPSNQINLCDNHHYATHVAIDALLKYGGDPPPAVWKHFGRKVKALAQFAWDNRPPGPLPRTLHG